MSMAKRTAEIESALAEIPLLIASIRKTLKLPTRRSAEFREEDHPRDEVGKFTDKGDAGTGSAPTGGSPSGSPPLVATKRVNPEWVQKVKASVERNAQIEVWAQRAGMDPAAYEAAVDAHIAEAMKDAHVFVRVPDDVLKQVMADGRLKNQFETDDSQGNYNHQMRDRIESGYFGVAEGESDPSWRPIYGYLWEGDGDGEYSSVSSYGSVRIQLRDSVKERTTFTFGDSLDATFEYAGDNNDKFPDGGALARPVLAPQPVLQPTSLAYDFGAKSIRHTDLTPKDFMAAKTISELGHCAVDRYAEAQIHGPVRLRDIKAIDWPYAAIPDWLREAHRKGRFVLTNGSKGVVSRGDYGEE